MNELQKLYDVLVREGKYTKSFEEFQNQWNDEQYQSKVYEVVHRDGLYTKDRNSFNQKYGAQAKQQRELPRMPRPGELANIGKEDENATFDSQGNYNPINALPESVRVGAKQRMAENKVREEAKKKEVDKLASQSDLSARQDLVESTARQQEEAYSSASQRYEAAAEKFPILRNELLKDVYQQLQKEQDLPDFVKNQLNQITPDLINLGEYGPTSMPNAVALLAAGSPLAILTGAMSQTVAGFDVEEAVVPKMNYMFAPLGFKFEESGMTGDYMVVTAPNSKDKIEISLNNFTQSSNAEEAKKLKNFIAANSTKIPNIENVAGEYVNKVSSQADIDHYTKTISKDYENLNKDATVLANDIKAFETNLNELNSTPMELRSTPEYLEKKKSTEASLLDINTRRQQIIDRNLNIEAQAANLDKSVGKYAQMKSEQGTWTGATFSWLGEGVSSILAGGANLFIDLASIDYSGQASRQIQSDIKKSISDQQATGDVVEDSKNGGVAVDAAVRLNNYLEKKGSYDAPIPLPKQGQTYKDWYNSLSSEDQGRLSSKIDDDIIKRAKQVTLPAIRNTIEGALGDPNTTVEWKQLAEENFWGGAYAGLIKSAPAMATPGGWVARTAAFFAQSTDAVNKEMDNNPDFADVPESEKLLVTIPIGVANAVLEEVGLSNMIKNKGFVNNLLVGAMRKAGVNATETTLSKIIKNDVESMLARGVLTLAGGGLAEAETGALQQVAEYAVKDIYNMAKNKQMFDTPDSLNEYVYEVAKAGAQEAVGGMIMSVPSASAAAYRKRGFKGMSDEQFKTFEAIANDEKMQSSFIATLKTKVAAGDMTMAEAKEELNDYRNSVGLYRSIPTDLSTEAKKEAMNLVREKQVIEERIKDKDEALVKKQKDRIAEINVQLNNLSENAVQEQTTSEVPIQSEAGVGEEVAQGKPTAEPQVTTEEGKEEEVTPEMQSKIDEIEARRQKELVSEFGYSLNDLFERGYPKELDNKNEEDISVRINKGVEYVNNKINAKYDAELADLKTTPVAETATEVTPTTEGALTEMQKAEKQLDAVESQINPNANHPLFNVGQQHNDGNKYRVFSSEDERTDRTKDGVEIITKVYEPATVDENGKMLSIATVQVTIFDSYEQAQEFINSQYAKYKAVAEERLAKAKATPTAEVTTTEEVTPESVVSDIDTELKTINESIGRVKQDFNQEEDDRILYELGNKVVEAKRNLSKAEDTDAAINELKKAEKEKSDFEESLAKRKDFNDVDNLIADEIENSKKDRYEYKDLFEQDPRLAAMQSAKDMIEFAKENPDVEINVAKYENDIKLIEEDIAKFPVKTAEVTPAAKAAPTPKKRGRKKSAPVAEVTPTEEVNPVVGSEAWKQKEEANRKKIIEFNKNAKENRGENINIKDFKRTKKRGQDLKIGDVYVRKILGTNYVFKVLSKLTKNTGQFYWMEVEVLHIGNDYVRQELDPNNDIREVGRKVGDTAVDSFKNMASGTGKLNFGEVIVLENFETAPKAAPAVEVVAPAPVAEAAPAPKVEPAPTPAPAKTAKEIKAEKELDEEIKSLEREIDNHVFKIEDLENEIKTEKENKKEGVAEFKEQIAEVKQKISDRKKSGIPKETIKVLVEELEVELDELEAKLFQFREDQDDYVETYKDDIVQEKADMKKAQKRLDKLTAKREQATQPAAAPKKRTEILRGELDKRYPLVVEFFKSMGYDLSRITSENSLDILAAAYQGLSRSKVGAEKLLLQITEIENLVEELDQDVKKVSKDEFKKQIAESGDFNKKQLKIFNALIDSLQTELMPEYMSDEQAKKLKGGDNFYVNSLNQIISKDPQAFIHEVGHFGFYKVLSKEDRLNYYRYMIDSNYGKSKPSLASRMAISSDELVGITPAGQKNYVTSNATDNFAEYFAVQFEQWYMGERIFPKDIDAIFDKVAKFFNLLIEKLKSGKYVDQNLSEYFNKISAKIEKDQKKNEKIQEALGIEETMMDELQDLEDFFGIDPAISPMSMRYDTPLQKMALMYNMTESGFFPNNASEPHINRDFFQFGLKAKRASSGSYYLVNINTGKMVKPLQRPKGGIPPQVSRMSVTPISVKDMAMEDVIDTARENGFSDDTIKALLIKRGYDPKEVDSALTFNVNFASAYTNNNPTKDSPLPQAFRTIDGGVSDGIKLFFDVRNKLIDFAQTTKKKGMKAGKRVRTYAEIRAKAIELLEASPIFQAQTDTKQKELIAAFDKTLNIKRGKLVSAQIADIRKALKERLVGMKDLKKAQLILRNFIRQSLPAVKVPRVFFTLDGLMSPAEGINYYNNLRKQVYDFARTAPDGKMGKKILKTSDEIRTFAMNLIKDSELYKKQTPEVQSDMVNGFINSEYTKGPNNTLDIYSQKEVNKLIDIVSQTDAKNFLAQAEKVFDIITEQRAKIKAGLLKDMMTLVNKKAKAAITTTGKRRANGLDAQGQSFYQAIKPIIKAAITNDTDAMIQIATELSDTDAIDDALAKEAAGEKLTTKEQALLDKVLAFDTFGDILNMELEEVQNLLDGLKGVRSESIVRLNEKRAERAAQREAMTEEADNQIRDGYEMLFNADGTPKDRNQLNQDKAAIWQAFKDRKVWSSLKQWLDRYDFVTSPISDYFRKKLAHLGTISNILDKTGTFFTDNLYRALNRMDESNKTGYLNEMNGLDDMANSINGVTKGYKQIRRMIESVGVVKMVIDGKNVIYNGDQLLRIYALSLNEVQRNKLKNMGFTEDKINDIKKKLGPEAIEFADKLVEYFSNEYFESINDIYALVNDVNLGYVENYFPTQTLAAKVDGKLLEDGDFNGIFNAESSPAFKERTDMSSPVDLSASFTNVVESHFQAMERYKAYAVGVKRLNELFKIPSVNVLLEETGLKSITKNLVNMSVNPNAGVKQTQTKLSAAMNKFSGYALAFKLAQIQKQATAIVAAYEDYQFLKGRKMPALDTAMFIIDVAKAITFARYNFNKFYNLSGNFRDRVNKGVEGDVYGLESGGKIFKPLSQKATRLADVKRFIKSAAASPTMVGDIISVYGYMANYNRDIANGMSPEAALEKFNNYNATLQSRRATDKSTLQFSQNELTRAFTMFGSTGLLQVNKVAMAYKNIMRSIANGKVPSGKDTRAFALNLGVANALFVGASYIFALIKGDDEDKEKIKDKMFEALVGLNLLYQIPLIGAAAEEVANAIKGEKTMGGDVTNPYSSVFRKIKKQYDEDNNVIQNFRPVAEFALGMQFDPFIALYEGATEEFDDEVMYDILGISPSYRPQNASSLENMNKTELKKYKPEEYERLYGPGSEGYDEEQAKKEAKAAERKARKDAMDDYYNYSSGDGVKRGGSRIGGRGGSRTGGSRTK